METTTVDSLKDRAEKLPGYLGYNEDYRSYMSDLLMWEVLIYVGPEFPAEKIQGTGCTRLEAWKEAVEAAEEKSDADKG